MSSAKQVKLALIIAVATAMSLGSKAESEVGSGSDTEPQVEGSGEAESFPDASTIALAPAVASSIFEKIEMISRELEDLKNQLKSVCGKSWQTTSTIANSEAPTARNIVKNINFNYLARS